MVFPICFLLDFLETATDMIMESAADMLDEETDQTVEEIEMIKSMLQAVSGDDDQEDDTVPVLDRPTHTGMIDVLNL